ncbi:MAG: hypothetical protein L6R41_001992 [Letrouitia leprolyta]|nr:MAG: hypothetical protein L6R41_001992 [Letrouitia leprolyta]
MSRPGTLIVLLPSSWRPSTVSWAATQDKSPYTAPTVPALTREGFVRWQTVQILLEPDEHVAFLQNAVKRLEIINPADGTLYPHLPRDALPSRPDPEMVQWHEGVAARLINETYAIEDRASSAGKDGEIGGDHALIDTARYTHPRPRPPFRPPPSINLPQAIDAPSSHSVRVPAPWDLERRRSSASDIHDPPSSSWPLESSTSAAFAPNDSSHRRRPRIGIMAPHRMLPLLITSLLASLAAAAVRPDSITAFQAIQKPAPAPGTHLNMTSKPITLLVPSTDILLVFRNFGELMHQTELSLCLLEGCGELFVAAVKRGDGPILNDKFIKSYSGVELIMKSYSPPAFKLTYGDCVNVLRGIGLFMSMYGYFQVKIDIRSGKDGYIGVGSVE